MIKGDTVHQLALCPWELWIQLIFMRKDDAVRPDAAVIKEINWILSPWKKQSCVLECRCHKGEFLFNSPPWEKTTASAWVPLSSNRILSASAPVTMFRFFLCRIGLRREEIFVSNKTCTVSDFNWFQDLIRTYMGAQSRLIKADLDLDPDPVQSLQSP